VRLIKDFVTWGVTTLLPYKKYHPEIYERRGKAQET
jgi:hypothetical protein